MPFGRERIAGVATSRRLRFGCRALLLCFAAVTAFTLVRHEMWMDELNPWVIARDSTGVSSLLANTRYEGHPLVWYLLLFAVSRFTPDPRAMQLLQCIIATSLVALICWAGPFHRAEKWLLAFGYFFVYEYAVLSRPYALGALLAFLICALLTRPAPPLLAIAVLLAVLANTSAYGWILSLALTAALFVDPRVWHHARRHPGRIIVASIVVISAVFASAVSAQRAPDNRFAQGWHLAPEPRQIAATLSLVWEAYLPLPDPTVRSPWNQTLVVDGAIRRYGDTAVIVLGVGALLLVCATAFALRGNRQAVVIFLVATLLTLALIYAKYSGGIRHQGHIFVALIAALWVARGQKATRSALADESSPRQHPGRPIPRAHLALELFLLTHVAAGIFFVVQDVRHPFSFSRQLAGFVQALPPPTPVVVAAPTFMNYAGPVLSGYLRRPVYYVLGRSVVRTGFTIWDEERALGATEDEIIAQLHAFAEDRATDVYVVTNNWFPDHLGQLLATFDAGLEGDERSAAVYLYRRADRAGGPQP